MQKPYQQFKVKYALHVFAKEKQRGKAEDIRIGTNDQNVYLRWLQILNDYIQMGKAKDQI